MEHQLFTDQCGRDLHWKAFLSSPLGQLYQAIPFDEIDRLFPKATHVGRPDRFGIRGGVALQILKSYLGLSDEKLAERLNTDRDLQFFCGIRLGPGERLADKDLVGRWRRKLGGMVDYEALQSCLVAHWKPFMKQTHALLMDATCYESHLRYPTDVKLLWECCEWIWNLVDQVCQALSLPKPRRKSKEQRRAYIGYQKRRRKTHRLERKRRRSLLKFLAKGLGEWKRLMGAHVFVINTKTHKTLQTIEQVYKQQKLHFEDPQAKIKDRIVSLSKPYIRPIVRGKETRRVEFGAKVHCFVVDGINLLDYLSFDAFNESTRLQATVECHERYFGRTRQLGADQIYATNANRRFCTRKGIATSFVRKGPKPAKPTDTDKIRGLMSRARSAHMEGTFGNEKEHYGLRKVRARTEPTERLWIAFAIWTASAVKISRRMSRKSSPAQSDTRQLMLEAA